MTDYNLDLSSGGFSITGTALSPLKDSIINAATTAFSITGTAITWVREIYIISADAGSTSITGTAAEFYHYCPYSPIQSLRTGVSYAFSGISGLFKRAFSGVTKDHSFSASTGKYKFQK